MATTKMSDPPMSPQDEIFLIFENFLEFFLRFMQHLSSQTTTRRLGELKIEFERTTHTSA
jgi:hypothetical protein